MGQGNVLPHFPLSELDLIHSAFETWSSPAQESGINEGRVRERRLCRSVVFKRSNGVVECWSIVQDSVFDGEQECLKIALDKSF